MFTRYAVPLALGALMLAGRPALGDEPGFLGLQIGPEENGKGVQVMGVFPDSAAAKAGVKQGDVITELDGKAASEVEAFVKAVGAHKVGDEVSLKLTRDGKDMTIKVKLGKRPAEPPPAPPEKTEAFAGVAVAPESNGKGVEVMDVFPDGPAAKAGLKKGDVITTVDGKAVADPAALGDNVSGHKPGDEVTFKVLRDGKEQEVKVKLGTRPER